MGAIGCKLLMFGQAIADRMLEIANPRDFCVVENFETSIAHHLDQPVVIVAHAFDFSDSSSSIAETCLSQRKNGSQIAVMGVLDWDTLRTATGIKLESRQLAIFDDLLLLPAKPFEFDLRFAKLEQTAMSRNPARSAKIQVGPLTFDVQSMNVEVYGKHIRLTRKEAELLLLLARNPNQVITKERIAHDVWHIERCSSSFENVLTGHVSRLREKLGDAGCRGLLRTVRRVGLELQIASQTQSKEKKPMVTKTAIGRELRNQI